MYQIDMQKFGSFLITLRKEKNLTQKELGERLFVSDKTVSKWERGQSIPNVSLLNTHCRPVRCYGNGIVKRRMYPE